MALYEVECFCLYCRFWKGNQPPWVYADLDGEAVWVGQCLNQEDERAPVCHSGQGSELAVFTRPVNACAAFQAWDEDLEDSEEFASICRRIGRELARQAWT